MTNNSGFFRTELGETYSMFDLADNHSYHDKDLSMLPDPADGDAYYSIDRDCVMRFINVKWEAPRRKEFEMEIKVIGKIEND